MVVEGRGGGGGGSGSGGGSGGGDGGSPSLADKGPLMAFPNTPASR